MTTATKTVGAGGGFTFSLHVTTTSQNISANTSVVAVSFVMTKNNYSTSYSNSQPYSVTVNGVTKSGTTGFSLVNGQTHTIASYTQTISHNADGTKSISASASFTGFSDYTPSASLSLTHTLATIPRKSSMTVPTVTIGSAASFGIARASSSFTHTIKLTLGAKSSVIATKTTATSVSWTPPVDWHTEVTNSTTAKGTATIETFNGTTSLGSNSYSVTFNVSSAAVPSVGAITVSEANSKVTTVFGSSTTGVFVQGQSSVNVAVATCNGYYGSTVNRITITGTGSTATISANTGSTNVAVPASGTITLTVTATDTRGRSNSATKAITVKPYSPPTLSATTAFRSLSNGTSANSGVYVTAGCTASASSLKPTGTTELNTLTLTYAIALKDTTSFTTLGTQTGALSYTNNRKTSSAGSYPVSNSYTVRITATDKLTSSVGYAYVATDKVVVDIDGESGLGIGKYRERGRVDVNGDVYTRNAIVEPVGVILPYVGTTAPTGWLLCNGASYSKTTYPELAAVLGFNGTETTFTVPDLRGRFLAGAGPARTNSSNFWGTVTAGEFNISFREYAGEYKHTLTVDEMPNHDHPFKVMMGSAAGSYFVAPPMSANGGTPTVYSGSQSPVYTTGNSQPHNNMPPYFSVNFIIRA